MFCDTFRKKIKSFIKKLNDFLKAHVDNAITITSILKNYINSPLTASIVDLTPNTWDNQLRDLSIKYLEKALIALDMLKLESGGLTNQSLNKILEDVKKMSPDAQDSILFKIASLLTALYDGNQLDKATYDLATQSIYTLNKKG